MATLEQIIEQAMKLPPEDQRRLRAALESLESTHVSKATVRESTTEKANPAAEDTSEEMRARRLEWLKSNRDEYGGQYVALDGDQLVAVGPNYRVAIERARAAGTPKPFVTYLAKSDEVLQM